MNPRARRSGPRSRRSKATAQRSRTSSSKSRKPAPAASCSVPASTPTAASSAASSSMNATSTSSVFRPASPTSSTALPSAAPARKLRIEAVPGQYIQRHTVTVREPFLFDQPYSLTESAYYRSRIFNEYTEGRVGGRVTVGHQFTSNWSRAASAIRTSKSVGRLQCPRQGSRSITRACRGQNFLVAPDLCIAYDTRGRSCKPTEGSMRRRLQYRAGLRHTPCTRSSTSKAPVTSRPGSGPDGSGKHVPHAFRSQLSWEGSEAPVYERYYGGGFQSIRGFAFRGVGPEVNGFKTGGRFQCGSTAWNTRCRSVPTISSTRWPSSIPAPSKARSASRHLPRLRRLRPAHHRADDGPRPDRPRLRLPDRQGSRRPVAGFQLLGRPVPLTAGQPLPNPRSGAWQNGKNGLIFCPIFCCCSPRPLR